MKNLAWSAGFRCSFNVQCRRYLVFANRRCRSRNQGRALFDSAFQNSAGCNLAGEYLLACKYINGNGVTKDFGEGIAWLQKSALGGYSRAQSDLGAFYLRGEGVNRDTDRAQQLFSDAAQQGDPSGSYDLGVRRAEQFATKPRSRP